MNSTTLNLVHVFTSILKKIQINYSLTLNNILPKDHKTLCISHAGAHPLYADQ